VVGAPSRTGFWYPAMLCGLREGVGGGLGAAGELEYDRTICDEASCLGPYRREVGAPNPCARGEWTTGRCGHVRRGEATGRGVRVFLGDHGDDLRTCLRNEVESAGFMGGSRSISCTAM
jgi:hypothetical protein